MKVLVWIHRRLRWGVCGGFKGWAGFELESLLGGGRTHIEENLWTLHILECLCSPWHLAEEQMPILWV